MTPATPRLRLFAATPDGPVALPPPGGVSELNDAFDHFPLGIYEGLRTVDGERLVELGAHLERARRSIVRLGWDFELDEGTLCTCMATVLEDSGGEDSRVRFDVLARAIDTPHGETRVLFGLTPLVLPPPSAYDEGVGVRTLRELERRDPLIKRASFVVERRDFPLGVDDAFERLLVDRSERVLECTSSSFFGVRGRTIATAGSDVLEGVTAARVIELARAAGYAVENRGLSTRDLAGLDETFLTSSIKGVVPVVRVDGNAIGTGRPGEVTRDLVERYDAWMHRAARTAREVPQS